MWLWGYNYFDCDCDLKLESLKDTLINENIIDSIDYNNIGI